MPIAVSGIFGAMSVIVVNSWMNTPGGFTETNGQITSVNTWHVFFSRSSVYEMRMLEGDEHAAPHGNP